MEFHFHEGLWEVEKKLIKKYKATSKEFSEILKEFHNKIPWDIPEDLKTLLTNPKINILKVFGNGFIPKKSAEGYTSERLSDSDIDMLKDICVYDYMRYYQGNGSDFLFYFEDKTKEEIKDIFKLNDYGQSRKGNSPISESHFMDISSIEVSKRKRTTNYVHTSVEFEGDQETWDLLFKLALILKQELNYNRTFLSIQDKHKRTREFLIQRFEDVKDLEIQIRKRIEDLKENRFLWDIDLETNEPIYATIDDIGNIFLKFRENRIKIEMAILEEYVNNKEYYDGKWKRDFEAYQKWLD